MSIGKPSTKRVTRISCPDRKETGSGAIDEIDSGVILSAAEEELEESPEDELPLLKPPQVAKKVEMLPSDGWKAVKRSKTVGR